jgi:DNA-binding CsgD family transcriptional regulator
METPMPRRRNLTESELDRIVKMRERGLGFDHIGKEIGCSSSAVYWHCLRLGAEPPKPQWPLRTPCKTPVVRQRGGHTVRLFTQREDERLLQMRSQGLSIAEISRQLDRRSNSVVGRLMALARHEARREQAASTGNCQPPEPLLQSGDIHRDWL